MAPKAMSQAAIERLITQRVNAAVEAERARQVNARRQGGNANEAGGQGGVPAARECTFSGFMKCNPTVFHGHEGAVELSRWFEKTEMVFGISECAEARKVKFAAATLQGRALTWWNSQVKEFDITAYTKRFHELVQLCPEMVLSERKKIEAYIQGLTDNIKGTVIGSKPTSLNEAVRMAHALMEQKNNNRDNTCHNQLNNQRQGNAQAITTAPVEEEKGHTRNYFPKKRDPQGEEAQGLAYVIRDAEKQQGPNVVMGTFLLNNRYATVLFDSGSDKSFVNTSFSHLIDINPVRLDTSYEVELADGRVLGTFDVVIGMDWLVYQDSVIVCGKKASKYIERGHQLFVAHVTEKEPKEKCLEDVPVIQDFPEVFPDDLSGLPPPRQVEFKIELIPGAAPTGIS
ncbi:putative reverse transcriptase domain-containing protein [Tanacetum coccineum]